MSSPTEKRFEAHIESQLQKTGYSSIDHSAYDRKLCLIKEPIINFIKTTQPEEWRSLTEIYGLDTENTILSRISSGISKKGILHALRNKVVDRGIYLNLCYFEPKSDLNVEHQKLYESNQFSIVRQLHYSNQNKNSIDMVLFLNGLPIVTMELKNQLTGQNIKHSEHQYRNDRNPGEALLKFKRCLVHFCVDNDKISMTTRLEKEKTFFLPYNRGLENPWVENGYRTEYLWKDILTPTSLLDILENFAHVSEEKKYSFDETTQKVSSKKKEVLIFPRYHQRDLILKFRKQLKASGVGKNYLVQHTTGSGKSYSIGWLSHTLASLYQKKGDKNRMFDSIIVVTDRTVLDDQLRNTIKSLEKIDGVVSGVEHGSKELKTFLEQGKDIVITTIQKFPFISKTISALGSRTFAVIIDEVHSSQSGEMAKELKKTLSKTDDEDSFDYEEMLRQEIQSRGRQKHISFFGFTGTPKDKTLELFGTKSDGQFHPFHLYSMNQSIHEKFTLDVIHNYTTYKRYFTITQIDDVDKEIPSSKGKRALIKYVDYHEMNIKYKVDVILDHWINKGSKEIQGQARGMVVTQSRQHCVLYFKEINRQLEERGSDFRCLVGFSGEVSEHEHGEKYTESKLNKTLGHEGNIPHGLKNPKFRLLVVANKFQTGFDEPLLQSMYVDKILGGVQCVQTLSRLNRTASGKTQTFVLDFVNEPEDISKSFQRFYQSTILEGETDPNHLYDLLDDIDGFYLYTSGDVDRFCQIFFDPQRDEGALHPLLDAVVDKFKTIEDEEDREDFRSKIQSYIRMYGYLSQIITFTDIKLEKSFIFLKYLNKKLPKRDSDKLDILDAIDLESLRIQKQHEQNYDLSPVDALIDPPAFEGSMVAEPEYDFLSSIIAEINKVFGVNLTDENEDDLSRLKSKMSKNPEVKKIMTGNNSKINKWNFFSEVFDGEILGYVNERFDFYKKMEDNPLLKDYILKKFFDNYNQSLTSPPYPETRPGL